MSVWVADAGNYTKDLEESLGLQNALATVNTALLDTEGRCEAFKEQFIKYSFLWKTDMQQALQVKHHGMSFRDLVGGSQQFCWRLTVRLQLADCLRYERHVEKLGVIDLRLRFLLVSPSGRGGACH